jgi:DNA modification methylase
MPTVTRQNAPRPAQPTSTVVALATKPATPNLDHITAQLRPLAVACDTLVYDPDNARKHPEGNLRALKTSLTTYGQVKAIVVRRDTNVVLAGNGTLEAARTLGWKHLAAVFVDMDDTQARGYSIADNRTAEMAEWDYDKLAVSLRVLQDDDVDLAQHGWGQKHLNSIIAGEWSSDADADQVPSPPDRAVTRTGDIWILGDHRLMCGDSSLPADVDRLLDGQPIHLINTDPPYNVKVEPRSNNAIAAGLSSFSAPMPNKGGTTHGLNSNQRFDRARGKSGNTGGVGNVASELLKSDRGNAAFDKARGKSGVAHHQSLDLERHPGKSKATHKQMRAKDRPLANDFVSDSEFERLLLAWFGNMSRVMVPGGSFYIWGGYANCSNYPPALKACGMYFSQSIIWDKQHPVLTRKDFMGAHEWCFYGWKEGAGHKFYGPNNVHDLWHVKKVNPQNMEHLTEKPVELAARAITYSSMRGQNVLDLFGGSGSTLIGAHQTQRRAFLMELDTLYCDVIVTRYIRFTDSQRDVKVIRDGVEMSYDDAVACRDDV